MAQPPESGAYSRRAMDARRMQVASSSGPAPANLADILERVLDKGIVIAGDIQINLLDIELLTIKLRLLVASVERAQEMGINWWESDPQLSSTAKELEEENEDLRSRLERLEKMAGLPAPRPVEEEPGGETHVEVEEHEHVVTGTGRQLTKDELLDRAQRLDISGRSTMTKPELERAVADAETGRS